VTNKFSDIQWSRWSRLAIPLLILAVLFTASACAKNQPPVIQSITTEKIDNPATEYRIICKATDPDKDTLSYLWSADSGTIKGAGNSITWVAPQISGDYTIKVTVKDEKNGESTRSTAIRVELPKPVEPPPEPKPNHPPVITKFTSEITRIRIWTTTTIQCIAEDPDGDKLNYLWSAEGGKVQGEGNAVGWTAPGVQGKYKVTVKVVDDKGAQAEQSILMDVFCCGSG